MHMLGLKVGQMMVDKDTKSCNSCVFVSCTP